MHLSGENGAYYVKADIVKLVMSLYDRAQMIGSLNVKLPARVGKCLDVYASCFEKEFVVGPRSRHWTARPSLLPHAKS